MKTIITTILLLLSTNVFALDICNELKRKHDFSQIQFRQSNDEVEKLEELYHDVSFDRDVSKAIATASLVAMTAGSYGMLAAATKIAIYVPVAEAILLTYTANQSLLITAFVISKDLGERFEDFYNEESAEVVKAAYEKIRSAVNVHDGIIKMLDRERQKVDLDWDGAWNFITLGGSQEDAIQSLYEISKLKNTIIKGKLISLEKMMSNLSCDM